MDRKLESVAGHILVVDDDAALCRLVSRFLGAEGYSVQTVQTSRLGVERALSGSYDLVVLDVMLPEIDGFEVLRRIRTKSNTPVLMLTARGDDLDRPKIAFVVWRVAADQMADTGVNSGFGEG